MLITYPLGPGRVHVQGLVFVRRSQHGLGCWLVDPWHVRIRRYFIQAFLQSDARLGTLGLRYNPVGLLDCDRELVDYFDWLAPVPCPAAEAAPRPETLRVRAVQKKLVIVPR